MYSEQLPANQPGIWIKFKNSFIGTLIGSLVRSPFCSRRHFYKQLNERCLFVAAGAVIERFADFARLSVRAKFG